ncbi:MAG: hypothetical protein M3096_07060 [Actinomycetia bacterium]|nr:hypothetical protein [Actinomycetes bacterium]
MITITPEAQRKLADVVDAQDTASGVRVAVVRGPHGCVHGWKLELVDGQRDEDLMFAYGTLQVVMESELAEALEDATIDYREDGTAIGFKIDVPESETAGSHGDQGGCGNH